MRGRGPFQFTAVELFVLAAGFAVASVFIFLLGMYVGREVAFEHAPVDSRVARLPIDPVPRQAVAARPKAAFAGLAVAKPRAARKSPAKPISRPVQTARKPTGDRGDVAVGERPKMEARSGRAAPLPLSRPPTVVAEASPRRHGSGGTFLLTEGADRTARVQALPSGRRQPNAARGSSPAYTVQVLSTRDAGAAESLVRSLKARGYGAYVRPAQDSTGRWFRVRIGRFGALDSARALATRCRKELRLDQAYVISD